MTKDELRAKANELPLLPGVYLMMDKTGKGHLCGQGEEAEKPRQPVFSGEFLPQ